MGRASLGPDYDLGQRISDLERAVRGLSTRDVLQNASIGAGGLTIKNGGSLTVDGDAIFNGSLTVPAGSLNTGGNLSAGGSVTAGTSLNGASLSVSGSGSIGSLTAGGSVTISGGNITANSGTLYSLYAYNNPVVTSYLAAYINSDGRFGATPSALRFKQDIVSRQYSIADLMTFQIVNYRLIEAVRIDGEFAATEVGVIAEWLLEAGFPEFVVFNPETGEPWTVHYERLALVAISATQELVRVVQKLEQRLEAAGL